MLTILEANSGNKIIPKQTQRSSDCPGFDKNKVGVLGSISGGSDLESVAKLNARRAV
ncbi:MAG: hypothetical protein NKF39_02685 [Tropheryma whipplei]|nr:hypothetical protein [Tropheryma whipplei]MCO8182803.1 hypothetical protein [Tropheryma whipplei]MCO8190065.1 hypothetical protein [Tropheryma whipplei]